MQYAYSTLLWCVPGVFIVAYGLRGIATKNITTYGRGGRRDSSVGRAAVLHGLGVVLFGLAFIGFGLLAFIISAHA